MQTIRRFFQQLGIFPYLILGSALAVLALITLDYITTTLWVIDVERLDLVRAVAEDRANSPALLDAVYTEVVLAFLTSVALLIIGVSLPFTYLLNRRLTAPAYPPLFATVRQALWLGLWIMFCLWLQINRTLTIPVALLLLVVFVLLELILQIRTRTAEGLQLPSTPIKVRQKPPKPAPSGPRPPQPKRNPPKPSPTTPPTETTTSAAESQSKI